MGNYEKPVALTSDDLAEGIFLASGGASETGADNSGSTSNVFSGVRKNFAPNPGTLYVEYMEIDSNGKLHIHLVNDRNSNATNPTFTIHFEENADYTGAKIDGSVIDGKGTPDWKIHLNQAIGTHSTYDYYVNGLTTDSLKGQIDWERA